MNKGLQISLLVGLFAISTAAGYFISSRLFPKEVKEVVQEVKTVVEEPVKSPVPVIDSIASSWSDALKEYTLTVYASVETNEQLKWCLYEDESYHTKGKDKKGKDIEDLFNPADEKIVIEVPGNADGKYYFKIVNNETRGMDNEACCVFTDCKKPEEKPKEFIPPFTAMDVQNDINGTTSGIPNPKYSRYFVASPYQKVNIKTDTTGENLSYPNFAEIWNGKNMDDFQKVEIVELHWKNNKIYQMDINVY